MTGETVYLLTFEYGDEGADDIRAVHATLQGAKTAAEEWDLDIPIIWESSHRAGRWVSQRMHHYGQYVIREMQVRA